MHRKLGIYIPLFQLLANQRAHERATSVHHTTANDCLLSTEQVLARQPRALVEDRQNEM